MNKDEKRKYNKEYKIKNPEKIKEANRKWYKKNFIQSSLKSKKWVEKNKERAREISKIWYRNNPLASIKKRYKKCNFKEEDYLLLVKKQKNICAICKNKKEKLFIDHCHKNLKVRGLLCPNCNTLLGHANDNIEILKSAIKYLKKYE